MARRCAAPTITGSVERLSSWSAPGPLPISWYWVSGDHALAVKANQGQLHADLHDLFAGAEEIGFRDIPHGYHRTVAKDHGRIEMRQCWTLTDEESRAYVRRRALWPQWRSVVRVRCERRIGEQVSVEERSFIASLPGEVLDKLRIEFYSEPSQAAFKALAE